MKSKKNFFVIAALLILSGWFLRAYQYFINRSLWLDELALALNILKRSFPELALPLNDNQGAPLGFLVIVKLLVVIFGNHEYVLRAVPLLAGIASVLLLYQVSKNILSKAGTIFALVLISTSIPLIYYASEFKQYSSDVAITLILFLLFLRCLDEAVKDMDLVMLGIVGAACTWMSHPAIFILASGGIALLLAAAIQRRWQHVFKIMLMGVFWLASFVLLYFISLRHLTGNETLTSFWSRYFMPLPPWENWPWFSKVYSSFLANPLRLAKFPTLVSLLALAGIFSLYIRRWPLALMLTLPFLFLLAASALHRYPAGDRLTLFLLPLAFLILAEGLDTVFFLLSKIHVNLAWIGFSLITIILLAQPVSSAWANVQRPNYGEHVKPVLDYLSKNRLPGDRIYIYIGANSAMKYYGAKYGLKEGEYIYGRGFRARPKSYLKDMDQVVGNKRVWILFSHVCPTCKIASNGRALNEEEFILQYLESIGSRLDEFHAPGASVYLYNLQY